MKRSIQFWVLIYGSLFLVLLFLLGQTVSLFDYDMVAGWGLQEPVDEVSPVGVAFLKGYALGDTLFYIPLFLLGVLGLLRRRKWGVFAMTGALAISVYWPITVLYAVFIGRDAMTLPAEKYLVFSIFLPLIMIFGLWGMRYLYNHNYFRQ